MLRRASIRPVQLMTRLRLFFRNGTRSAKALRVFICAANDAVDIALSQEEASHTCGHDPRVGRRCLMTPPGQYRREALQ
jgi:hypothetical protein